MHLPWTLKRDLPLTGSQHQKCPHGKCLSGPLDHLWPRTGKMSILPSLVILCTMNLAGPLFYQLSGCSAAYTATKCPSCKPPWYQRFIWDNLRRSRPTFSVLTELAILRLPATGMKPSTRRSLLRCFHCSKPIRG